MHMDKKNTQFFLVILHSMRGNDIARVVGWWLLNRPNHSVPETQMTALRVMCALLIYFPPQNSMRDHCDVTLWHHDCLLYSFGRKTTAHVQRRCHRFICTSASITARIPSYYQLHSNLVVFSFIPNFMPVTLSPRYFGAPSYWSLDLFTTSKTKHRHA